MKTPLQHKIEIGQRYQEIIETELRIAKAEIIELRQKMKINHADDIYISSSSQINSSLGHCAISLSCPDNLDKIILSDVTIDICKSHSRNI